MLDHIIDGGETAERRVWLQCAAGFLSAARDELLAQFQCLGIFVETELRDCCGAGVLPFDEPSAEFLEFLEMHRHHDSWTLAVAARAEAIAGVHSWALLRAGAQDVLA